MNKKECKTLRKENNGIRYFGFNEVAKEVYNLKPVENALSQNNAEAKDKFQKHHRCKSCKNPLRYVGGNVMVCDNPECDHPAYSLLDEKGKNIAEAIFGESEVRA